MWYFSWILGVLFACCCGIINAMWVEMHLSGDRGDGFGHDDPSQGG